MADSVKTISVRIDLDEKDYSNKMKALRKEMEVFRSQAVLTNSEFIGQQNTLAALSARTGDLRNQIASLNKQIKEENEASERRKQDLDSIRERTAELNRQEERHQKTIESLNRQLDKYTQKEEKVLEQTGVEIEKRDKAAAALLALNKAYQGPMRDTEEYKKKHAELTYEYERSCKELERLTNEHRHNQTVIKRTISSIDTFKGKIAEEKQELNELADKEVIATNRLNEHTTRQNRLNAQLNETANSLRRYEEAENDASNSVNESTKLVNANTGALEDNEDELNEIANLLAVELVKKGYNVVKEAITESIDAYREYDLALKGVSKTTGMSGDELESLGEHFKALSTQVPISAKELLNVAQLAGQLGVSGKDNLIKFTETMAMLSVSTSLSAEEAGTALAQIAAVTGMSSDSYDRLGSAIVALGNNFAATEDNIVRVAQRFAGAAVNADLSEDAIVALAAASSAVGLQAESAGTSLTKLVQKMQDAVSTGDEVEAWAKIAGVSAEEFTRLWGEDATRAIAAFLSGIGKMGDGANAAAASVGINEARLKDLIIRLGNAEYSSGLVTRAFEVSNEAFELNNALIDEASIFYDALDSKINMFKNSVDVLGSAIGEQLAPQLEFVLSGGSDLLTVATRIVDVAPWIVNALEIVGIALAVLAAKTLPQAFTSIGNLIDGLNTMKDLMALEWTSITSNLTTAIGATGVSALTTAGYIGLIIAALVILIKYIEKYGEQGDVAAKKTEYASDAYETKAEVIDKLNAAQEELNRLTELAAREEEEVGEVSQDTKDALDEQTAAVNELQKAYDDLPDYIVDAEESQTKFSSSAVDLTEEINKLTEAYRKNIDSVKDFSTEYETSASDYLTKLQQQTEWVTLYSANREKLWNRDIDGLKEYITTFDNGTEEAAEQMNALAGASDELLEQIVKAWQEHQKAVENDEKLYEGTVASFDAAATKIEERVRLWTERQKKALEEMNGDFKVKIAEMQATINGLEGKTIYVRLQEIGSPLPGNGQYITQNAQGLEYVPYDGFLSALHEGEMVLNRAEASAYRTLEMSVNKTHGSTNNVTMNVYGTQGQSVQELANVVMTKIQQATDRRSAVWA